VVFALVAGAAFAVDLGGFVVGSVNVIEADSDGSPVSGSAGLHNIRLQGAGELADGQFGAWLRFDPLGGNSLEGLVAGIAWWKPIDQIKLSIGGNPDGVFAKEGNACWMFNQTASDTWVVDPGNAWWSTYTGGFYMRKAFFGGFGDNRLYLEISPVDMVGINIAIPFFTGGDIGDIFMSSVAQIDLRMSFGNIAFTYKGNSSIKDSEVFGFFSLTAIDNLQLDFGLGSNFNDGADDTIKLGVVVKYGADSWGIKFRSLFGIPTRSSQSFGMLFDVLPYFVINESFRAYVDVGMGIASIDSLSSNAGWHVNPYIEVGEEWGPKFLAGIKVWAVGFESPTVKFAVPVAIRVEF